jgi:predicted  nucleic acid-binding Zn-ribbon protein
MSMTKRYMEKLEAERRAKEERLLDLPDELCDATALVEEMQQHIRDLRATIDHDRSWKSKLQDYLIGGFVGAVIGFGLSLII